MFSQTVSMKGFTYQLFSMSYLWGFFGSAKSFYFVRVLLCAPSILATCGPRLVNGEQDRLGFELCGSYRGNSDMNFQDIFDGQSNSNFMSRNLVQKHRLENVCADFNAFCSTSTLPGYYSKENEDESLAFDVSEIQSKNGLSVGLHQERSNLSRSCGNFRLLGGKTICRSLFYDYQKNYCELPSHSINPRSSQVSDISSWRRPLLGRKTQNFQSGKNIRNAKSNFVDGLARPPVEIKPSLLDWGEKHLYFPSLAFLTVQNLDSDSSLNVYDPFSTNSQFYPCNFSEMVLIPGEVASICFVFFPTQLGLSSAQLVLQTSFGGFVIQAKGFVVNSPYWIKPSVGVDVLSGGRWRKNLSLLNRFNETLYVNEITAWISISSRNALCSVKVVCSINSNGDTNEYSVLSNNDWLVIESEEVDVPLIAMKPHINWELSPLKTETLMELDLSNHSEGKLFGAVCMKLLGSSKDDIDMAVVPLERNWRQISLGSIMQPPPEIKAVYAREEDELMLRSWKSHASASFMSVLDDDVMFPTFQFGSHCSRWITLKNPGQEPAVMQLILNAGEIIDECSIHDMLFQPPSSSSLVGNKTVAPTRYGFSIAKNALTKAFVYPYGRASLGPILFQSSKRCDWTSSALMRNNLSGVEWLTLRGFGGLLSLALLEESDPVQSLEFKSDLPTPLNFSLPETLHYMENRSLSCSQPLKKELYAKNMGDLPLEIRRISVSGAECCLNGFSVHTCERFSLQPGEFIKLQISYITDFSTAIIQRDLELVLATGILVVPMKASLPVYLLNFCGRSIFRTRVNKSIFGILFTASALLLLLFTLFPYVMAFVSQKNLLKNVHCSIFTINHRVKSSRSHRNHKNSSKFSMSPVMNDSLRSIAEEAFLLKSVGKYSDCQSNSPESVNASVGDRKENKRLLNVQLENLPSSISLSKSESDECSDMRDAAQTGNLLVKIRKERGKSRRKKKSTSTGVDSSKFHAVRVAILHRRHPCCPPRL
ncbi:isoform 2 of transmembrane 131-like [Olea europaea subsp. europaea]|uniref:Isoform 2 of transmembrane 131-like n=2 Tax=Olea europaea subsp. europaea TaxID=158383 RepID=A0A8S0RMZ3_OLEEU|nr:isoform 2 of transmembrane 131-like [Olea europaea subsp. europaea]